MRRAAMIGLAVVAGIAFAAPANATPEDDYLGVLSTMPGFTVNPFTSVLLTGAGNGYCADLRAGVPIDEVYGKAMAYPGSTNVAARQMVDAAQQTLCPDTQGAR
ncbi:DUF732 domain-containing protein [Streptomyces massasporeus]|uniref:DUF732 domain-containing protein n=1 Tax=Streptomyces massasporeus TaxID=67324 RepID=UPI003653EFE5